MGAERKLRAFDADLARTYLLAKLLGAVLVDAIQSAGPSFSPYGTPFARTSSAVWRISQIIWAELRAIVQRHLDLADWGANAQRWTKALYERPRRRSLQLDLSP